MLFLERQEPWPIVFTWFLYPFSFEFPWALAV